MRREDLGGSGIIKGETLTEDMEIRHVLEKIFVQPLRGTTPNVGNRRIFELDNTAPVTISDFINGSVGQRIYILGDGFTTITNGTLIKTNTGANKLLAVNKVYTFTFFEILGPPKTHKWVEDVDENSGGGGGTGASLVALLTYTTPQSFVGVSGSYDILWDTVEVGNSANYDPVNGDWNIQENGLYLIEGQIRFDTAPTSRYILSLNVGGVTIAIDEITSTSGHFTLACTRVISLIAGQLVFAAFFKGTGTAVNARASAGASRLTITKL